MISQRCGKAISRRHGISLRTEVRADCAAISHGWTRAIPAISWGSGRNQIHHAIAHTTPTTPITQNTARQPHARSNGTNRSGAKAAPMRPAAHTNPCMRACSSCGNHFAMTPDAFGYAPAVPRPKRNRALTIWRKLWHHPVATVKPDHQETMRVSSDRCPCRSPRAPEGISNSALAST